MLQGLLTGLAGSVYADQQRIEQENLRRSDEARQREGKIYEALLNSSDPDIQSLALTGLLHTAQPGKRAKGIRGWLGELEASPILPQMRQLLQTPVTETKPILGPAERQGYIPATPPATLPAAQSANVPTELGAELAAEERGLIPADTLPTQFYRREIDPVSGRTIALHPVTTPPSAAFTTRDALAMAIYGRRAGQLTQAELPAVLQAEQAMKNVVTRPQALTAAR